MAPLRVPCSARACRASLALIVGDGRAGVHFPTSRSWLSAHMWFAFVATCLFGCHIGVCRLFCLFLLHVRLHWPRLPMPSLVLSFGFRLVMVLGFAWPDNLLGGHQPGELMNWCQGQGRPYNTNNAESLAKHSWANILSGVVFNSFFTTVMLLDGCVETWSDQTL